MGWGEIKQLIGFCVCVCVVTPRAFITFVCVWLRLESLSRLGVCVWLRLESLYQVV